jgi:cytochrome bd-type quinol oxidase subunit 1
VHLVKLAALLVLSIPLSLFRGWVLALLWGWYVADYFGLRHLTVVEGVGLGILATLMVARAPSAEDQDRTVVETALISVSYGLIALLFGWLWSFAR